MNGTAIIQTRNGENRATHRAQRPPAVDDQREFLLRSWLENINLAAQGGAFGASFSIADAILVPGPRAGAILMDVGLYAARLKKALSAEDCAILRQLIPDAWTIVGAPHVFMDGRYVRVEAGWPDELAWSDIGLYDLLHRLNRKPYTGGRALLGITEAGRAVTLRLSSTIPHWLFAGTTRSGKSCALQSVIVQWADAGRGGNGTELILIDGKYGASLNLLAHLPGVLGPVATDHEDARAALSFAVKRMVERYRNPAKHLPLVVVIDEVQNFVDDPLIVELISKLVAQGAGASIHTILATQHPLNKAFGAPEVKRNLSGRACLHVSDFEASRAALGVESPRADRLQIPGDAYVLVAGHNVQRVQCAYLHESELRHLPRYEPNLIEWPESDAESINSSDQLPHVGGRSFSYDELAISTIGAAQGLSRDKLKEALSEADHAAPGSKRAMALKRFGEDLRSAIQNRGWDVCLENPDPSTP